MCEISALHSLYVRLILYCKAVAIYVCLFVSYCCCVFNFRGGGGVLLIVSDYVIYWLGVL